jgi:D-arabinose 1-dehydrogenase-like Zn-dependent alcohol dehydrogenase
MRCYCVIQHGQPLVATELPTPVPTGTQVLVKVKAAGLCHSDLHIWEGHYDLGGGKKLTMAERGVKPPLTLSHEIAGEVFSGGAEAGALNIGQRVLVHPWIGCGECAACKRGEENICIKPQALGVIRPGGFAEFVLVPHPRYLVPIDGMDAAAAAPLACAGVTTFSALKKFGSRIHEGPVVIFGAGGLGLMAIEVLKAMGGQGAIAVDVDASKRAGALEAGALSAIDARAPDVVQQIQAATGGGARAVLDLVGMNATVTTAVASCARGGHIVICGLMGGEVTLSLPIIPQRPLNIQGSYVGSLLELRELVALVQSGRLKAIPVNQRPLSEVNEAMEALHQGKIAGRTVLLPA